MLPILLAARQQTTSRVIHDLLGRLGFTDTEVVHDGGAALRLLDERKYGLVIADWDLQPMSGLQFLRAVKSDDKLRRVPFLMIGSEGSFESVVLARKAGANAYLLKPFSSAALLVKIEEVARGKVSRSATAIGRAALGAQK